MARYHSSWKPEEEELLIKLKEAGYEYQYITDMLPGRTLKGVKAKAQRLGLCKLTAFKIISQWADETGIMKMEG